MNDPNNRDPKALRITEDAMTLEGSEHSAHRVGDGWALTWLPGRILGRDQAISGMTLAETGTDLVPGDSRWPLIDTLAAELGLTGPDAVVRISTPLDDGLGDEDADGAEW